jgi:hypothetical protein
MVESKLSQGCSAGAHTADARLAAPFLYYKRDFGMLGYDENWMPSDGVLPDQVSGDVALEAVAM